MRQTTCLSSFDRRRIAYKRFGAYLRSREVRFLTEGLLAKNTGGFRDPLNIETQTAQPYHCASGEVLIRQEQSPQMVRGA